MFQKLTLSTKAGKRLYAVSSFTSLAKAFPSISLNFVGGASMLLKPEDYLLNTTYSNGVTLLEAALEAYRMYTILEISFLKIKLSSMI